MNDRINVMRAEDTIKTITVQHVTLDKLHRDACYLLQNRWDTVRGIAEIIQHNTFIACLKKGNVGM